MYVCGPTVYDKAHLGHGRSAVSFDVIRKYLRYKGYEVTFVSNYTDIDDKMIARAGSEGISVADLATKIIPEYEKDYGALGIEKPDFQPKATDYIMEIVELIKKLESFGYTYVLDDGIYYDVSKFKGYGKLSGQNLEDLKMGARVDVNDSKKNPYDFVLWKFKKEGEPAWKSPWGEGRPGWHIECSAMTRATLGEKFDIHGGGLDLKFPHHECEVAQSVVAFGKGSFAQYWLHNGFIQVNDEKMSKSLGNFFTLQDIFKKYDPQVVRFMFLQTHYRNPINFSDALLEQAKSGLERIHDFVRMLGSVSVSECGSGMAKSGESSGGKLSGKKLKCKGNADADADADADIDVGKYMEGFESAMDNDFDTSGAFGVVFELVKDVNTLKNNGKFVGADAVKVLKFLKKADSVLGVISPRGEEIIDSHIQSMIDQREEARKSKDFKKSDEIRAELLKKGIVLEDTPHGTVWKKT